MGAIWSGVWGKAGHERKVHPGLTVGVSKEPLFICMEPKLAVALPRDPAACAYPFCLEDEPPSMRHDSHVVTHKDNGPWS